ncbi:MAG: hypothetical protein ACP5G1_04070 [Nanopusillaceae archaeon]
MPRIDDSHKNQEVGKKAFKTIVKIILKLKYHPIQVHIYKEAKEAIEDACRRYFIDAIINFINRFIYEEKGLVKHKKKISKHFKYFVIWFDDINLYTVIYNDSRGVYKSYRAVIGKKKLDKIDNEIIDLFIVLRLLNFRVDYLHQSRQRASKKKYFPKSLFIKPDPSTKDLDFSDFLIECVYKAEMIKRILFANPELIKTKRFQMFVLLNSPKALYEVLLILKNKLQAIKDDEFAIEAIAQLDKYLEFLKGYKNIKKYIYIVAPKLLYFLKYGIICYYLDLIRRLLIKNNNLPPNGEGPPPPPSYVF